MRNSTIIIILVILTLCLCISCLFAVIGSAVLVNVRSVSQPGVPTIYIPGLQSTPSPVVVRPTIESTSQPNPPAPSPTPQALEPDLLSPTPAQSIRPQPATSNPPDPALANTLLTLENEVVPINDPLDLARRLEGKTGIPTTLEPPAAFFRAGDRKDFWVTDVDTNETVQIIATLQYVTEHTYFWVDDRVSFDSEELSLLAKTFENEIYPTTRAFFGSEWSPGVDGDPHIYIVYASGLGSNLAGYYSSADQYHPMAREYSNAHEMFLLNADNIGLDEQFTYGVLAHEFQHMIHWYQDRNEASWANEGFSELAAFLNGYYESGFDWLYARDPDLQLNDWPNDSNSTTPHYGASFLFLTYFLDRFGEELTRALVSDPADGLTSIDNILRDFNVTDPLTGQTIRVDDVFLDWVITNYLLDGAIGDGRYTYSNYPAAPQTEATETIRSCPTGPETRSVNQYGADYIRITCEGEFNLHFEGSYEVGIIPENPYSGVYAFWSNKGDESDMTLTRTFDFTNHSGELTFNYWTWYDLEEDYDYLYLVASVDGENWQILTTPSGTASDPTGNSYGWGYNGRSGWGSRARWIQESVDLSQFAGQTVDLRFEYVTDAAVNGEGFALDDVSIPQIGYFTDFEQDDGGWEPAGWARIQNALPQSFRLALISIGDQTTIETILLPADVYADIPLRINGDVNEVILVVAGTTRFTRQPAAYRFEISR